MLRWATMEQMSRSPPILTVLYCMDKAILKLLYSVSVEYCGNTLSPASRAMYLSVL